MFKRSLGTAAVLAGLLAAAAPAHAGTLVGNPGKGSTVIESVGTKYTMLTNEQRWFVPEVDDQVL
jgi:hypothetical protein